MPYLLGVDTGGTYTDAVLFDEDSDDNDVGRGIVAKAKAPTTHDDLAIGISNAVDAVIAAAGVGPDDVALVSLSTTLATNSLVEGIGGRVGLLFVGFDDDDLSRAGLADALGDDPNAIIAGGHNSFGVADTELDMAAVDTAITEFTGRIDAIAIAAKFSVRNPEHEVAIRDRVREQTDIPVTCGHELSAQLNGPKRALTCVLNARLIGVVGRLCDAALGMLAERSITAPVMLVRGDGSLVSVDFVQTRPIETILSGPAASIVGAAHLTDQQRAVVSDIGGTTTDIAFIENGRPAVSPDGAVIGGHRTMVQAVDMVTHGLGGDSEIRVDTDSVTPQLHLGPRRVVPVSQLAQDDEELVHETLDRQLASYPTRPWDGRFLRTVPGSDLENRTAREHELLVAGLDGWVAADQVLRSNVHHTSLSRLWAQGDIRVAGFTPTDAAHVLDLHSTWDRSAAEKVANLVATLDNGRGKDAWPSGVDLSRDVVQLLTRRSAEVVLDVGLSSDGLPVGALSNELIAAAFNNRLASESNAGVSRIDIGLATPLIALGASAATYYPEVGDLLGTDVVIPEHADVANAIGAVVGRVRLLHQATIAQPSKGQFRVHLPEAPHDFGDLHRAVAFASETLETTVRAAAHEAGARDVEVATTWSATTAMVEGKEVFVEGTATAEATGRPKLSA